MRVAHARLARNEQQRRHQHGVIVEQGVPLTAPVTWQELGHPSEAAYRQSLEDMRVRLARAKQRQQQHDYNRDVLYRMGFIED